MSRSEAEAIETELAPPFSVARPEALKVPLVFNSPHSGRVYPKAFLAASRLDSLALRRSEDAYVEELFGFVTGARRAAALCPFPARLSRRQPRALRARSGSVPRRPAALRQHPVGAGGRRAWHHRPDRVGVRRDLSRAAYRSAPRSSGSTASTPPIMTRCAELLAEAQREFGVAVLIDCHSMPSNPIADQGGARPDFVLGDRFGTSCSGELTRAGGAASSRRRATRWRSTSLMPAATSPSITADRTSRQHALQIEINRALYMDETSFDKSAGFDRLRGDLEAMVRAVMPRAFRARRSRAPQPNSQHRHLAAHKKGPLE